MQITRAVRDRDKIKLYLPQDIRRLLNIEPRVLIGWLINADGTVAIENLSATLEAARMAKAKK